MAGDRGAADEATTDEIEAALRDVARLGGFFALDVVRGPAPGEGRLTPEGFAALARTVNERCGTAEARVWVSVAHLGLLAFRRRSCCLYYRVPGGSTCGDCCLIR